MQRAHYSMLATAEKRLLIFLASKCPAWISPDGLTAIGVLGSIVVFTGYLLSHRDPAYLWLANLGLVVHWFGDSLDGTLARVRGCERPRYGFFLDQSVDVVGNVVIMVGAGLSPFMRLDTALLALTGYHALSIYSLIRSTVTGQFHVSMAGFGPTEIRIMLIGMNIGIFFGGAPAGFLGFERFSWCDSMLLFTFCVMAAIFLYNLYVDGCRLRDDPADRR